MDVLLIWYNNFNSRNNSVLIKFKYSISRAIDGMAFLQLKLYILR